MKNLICLLFLVFLTGCSKDDIPENEKLFRITDSNYPTSFKKLTPTQQQQKQTEFEEGQITFSLIDSFGFVGWSYDDDFEIRKQLYEKQFSDVSGLITSVKEYLLSKNKFTGIKDTTNLEPQKIIYQYIKGYKLELRVCYEFKPSHWQIFMDTTTGEILLEQDIAFYLL